MKTIHGMECMHIMESETNRFVYEEDIRRRYGSMAICCDIGRSHHVCIHIRAYGAGKAVVASRHFDANRHEKVDIQCNREGGTTVQEARRKVMEKCGSRNNW